MNGAADKVNWFVPKDQAGSVQTLLTRKYGRFVALGVTLK
ncbi:MAG: hypothetical protein QOE54_1628 [Streptosporangiaceae bacterium]|jgi:hypothetical protein|nr:hypothetical protein [Streptosporangiaceae bacterium]MDX6429262.1 hypothetical protein [Streptosporangiaceae bacterium]